MTRASTPSSTRPRRRVITASVAAVLVAAAVPAAAAVADSGDSPTSTAGGEHSHSSADHGPHEHPSAMRDKGIPSEGGDVHIAAFDLVKTTVERKGDRLVFTEQVRGRAGSVKPAPTGRFADSSVLSYVWPLSLDPASIGFTEDSGVLALAATSHPDFDDTPLYDENHNGIKNDDGGLWHSHWVVLVPDTTRPDGALKVRDILPGEKPDLPRTWPGVPLYLDSPAYPTRFAGHTVRIEVPAGDLGFPSTFSYDGVTAALKINGDLHDPLLRVDNVFDVASGDLSLPGRVRR